MYDRGERSRNFDTGTGTLSETDIDFYRHNRDSSVCLVAVLMNLEMFYTTRATYA
jgi:hypothetical protein